MIRVMSACSTPLVMFLMKISVSGCNAEGVTPPLRVDSFGVQEMVTPCLSALWDHAFRFHGRRQFRMLCTSSMPSGTVTILSLLSGPGYAISSSGFLSSDVPDSELQASVSHTLDVGNWWLDSRHCCVHLQAVEGHGLSGVIKTRHHDLQLSDTTVASQ